MQTRRFTDTIAALCATAALAALLMLAGCDKRPDEQAPPALQSQREKLERRAAGCGDNEDCASVAITLEIFEQRPKLNSAIRQQLIRQLRGNGETEPHADSLEALAEAFLKDAAQMPGSAAHHAQLTGDAKRSAQRGHLLTVAINSYAYTGGAHGMPATHWLNWDLAADQHLPLAQVIQPGQEAAFWARAEDAHQRWLSEEPAVDETFREIWPFQRSDDFRFDDDGMVLLYNPYALGPYAIGSVQLTLPWEDLRGVVREAYLPE
jgi:hypothetical protein